MTDLVLHEVRDQAMWITINRPEVRNAFREQTLDELIEAFSLERFNTFSLLDDKAATAASH